MAKKCIFFALIFSGLRGCFSKNGVFAYKMNFVENFFERHKKDRHPSGSDSSIELVFILLVLPKKDTCYYVDRTW